MKTPRERYECWQLNRVMLGFSFSLGIRVKLGYQYLTSRRWFIYVFCSRHVTIWRNRKLNYNRKASKRRTNWILQVSRNRRRDRTRKSRLTGGGGRRRGSHRTTKTYMKIQGRHRIKLGIFKTNVKSILVTFPCMSCI